MASHYFSEEPLGRRGMYEFTVAVRGLTVRIVSSPGVFSAARLDRGTRLLVESMVVEDGWRVLDLGTGYGVIGIVAAKLAPRGYVVMTDINRRAVRLARLNLRLNGVPNAEVRWGDLYEPVRGERFNTIVANPPISAGMETCLRIVDGAPEHLVEGGLLQLVARHNKGGRRLMARMEEVFGNVEVLAAGGGYRVYASRLSS